MSELVRSSREERPAMRAATPRDVHAVLEVWRRGDTAPSATDDQHSVSRLLAFDSEALLVAEAKGEVIGTVVAAFDGWRANLYRLVVVPEHRRRGVARALVEEAERRLRARGARRFSALVLQEQAGAAGFWEAMAYERDPRTTRFTKTA